MFKKRVCVCVCLLVSACRVCTHVHIKHVQYQLSALTNFPFSPPDTYSKQIQPSPPQNTPLNYSKVKSTPLSVIYQIKLIKALSAACSLEY